MAAGKSSPLIFVGGLVGLGAAWQTALPARGCACLPWSRRHGCRSSGRPAPPSAAFRAPCRHRRRRRPAPRSGLRRPAARGLARACLRAAPARLGAVVGSGLARGLRLGLGLGLGLGFGSRLAARAWPRLRLRLACARLGRGRRLGLDLGASVPARRGRGHSALRRGRHRCAVTAAPAPRRRAAAQRLDLVAVGNLDRDVHRDRPRLGVEQQRKADHARPAPAPRRRSAGAGRGGASPRCFRAGRRWRPRGSSPPLRNLKKAMKRVAPGLRGQVFGLKAGHSVLQHAAHRVERSEDEDSISGVRGGHRCAQGRHRGRRACSRGTCRSRPAPATRLQRLRRLAARGVGRSVKYQRSISGADLARTSAPGPCRPWRRTPHGCAG